MEPIIHEADECVIAVEHWTEDYTVFWITGPDKLATIQVCVDGEAGITKIWGGEIGGVSVQHARAFAAALLVAVDIAEAGINWKPEQGLVPLPAELVFELSDALTPHGMYIDDSPIASGWQISYKGYTVMVDDSKGIGTITERHPEFVTWLAEVNGE